MRNTYFRWSRLILATTTIALLSCPLTAFADDASLSQDAHAKYDAGDYAGAKTLFLQLLQEYPTTAKAPDAELHLARIKWKTKDGSIPEQIAAFSEVRAKYPSSPEAGEALLHVGYLRTKVDSSQAVADLTEFLQSYPTHARCAGVQQSLGRLYVRIRDLDKAEAAFDNVKTMPNASVLVVDEAGLQSGFVKIMRFYASKDKSHLDAAIQALGRLTSSKRPKTRARAELGIAESLLLAGKAREAHDKYSLAAKAYEGDPYFRGIALYGAACCSQTSGDWLKAEREYAQFLAAEPGVTLGEKNAAWRSAALGSTSEKVQASIQETGVWDDVPALDILQVSAYMRGECLYMLGRYTEAASQFQDVLDAFPASEIAEKAQTGIARVQMVKGGQ